MIGALVFLFRIIVGLVILAATWFVFDRIQDRNTEIIVATIGLLYSFVFIVSRRLQYFGLTIFSFFGRTVPIRLTQTPARCRVRPRAGIKVGIGRRLNTARDAEQRAERVERVETPVEAERELIEVGL